MNSDKKEYAKYIENKAKKSPVIRDTALAFLFGGVICDIGQAFFDLYSSFLGMSKDLSKTAVSVTMIFLGSLLTGLNLYHKIAKHAGAGTIVPITGFANSIVSPAMEFRREGLVLGLASKMFVVAGPVLVYGIASSVVVGLVYYFLNAF